jgi:histidinol-phosphate aminotransferase
MMRFQKPAEFYEGLRLHQNENTGGCSPRVLEALARLTPQQIGFYPPYERTTRAVAAYLGVAPDDLSLLNGLDEGVMAAAVGYLRADAGGTYEAIVPDPAFEIFSLDAEVVGATPVHVAPTPDFSFPLAPVLAAITPRTRVVFITNPNNPTGATVPLDAIRQVSRALPPGAIVFLDEAYAEFTGVSFIPELPSFKNIVIGRTFSKAFGLAGIRIGAITGHPETLEPIRMAVPVYSVNVAATVAVEAALEDRAYMEGYLRQVEQSKSLLYAACDRLGLGYWKSAANFVLVKAGPRVDALVTGALARGIYLRDRSTEPGCAGCFRIATGLVDDTRRAIEVIEEALCAVR